MAELVKTALQDAQELVRSEIALAKAEIRGEVRRLGVGLGLLVSAAVAAVLAVTFLLTAVAWGLSLALAWPVWAGFAVVTGFLLVVAALLALVGKRKLAAGRLMPKTMQTMKENSEWLRARTS